MACQTSHTAPPEHSQNPFLVVVSQFMKIRDVSRAEGEMSEPKTDLSEAL